MKYSLLVPEWIKKAGSDKKCARILLEHSIGNEVVVFHCHQAIEKALKGYILYLSSTLESGHSLLYLCKKIIKKNEEFSKYIDVCMFVNQYYIETRYPNENAIVVTNEEAQKCINITEEILNEVTKNIQE